ncbi:hypothetical protein PC116_g12654 [Phytophthora cactorum]|uniref:Uncharacterized protein n=1 Tax=Phytophthora cactorum TaxID=29920 RepID=A0A8T1DG65_9STRA|nr:hypothetical protein PC112_g15861 [Phytophthora cactorum]KAG2828418.1 hypothetical protein PC111_g8183 [Phytophthora cactorum]KAG2859111.1 hypothetical protein PC113_g9234 [Phytophthora cactorum]KAG2939756.1 hypothetical protein PC115_g2952 [Phytophthora cactorum]KAG2943185.1 hypothetical protein PC117_g9523 [Phytophthora cactorum]
MQSDTKPRASTQTPRFSYLLRLGLESIGVRYASIDLLRKAKKNQTAEREYWAMETDGKQLQNAQTKIGNGAKGSYLARVHNGIAMYLFACLVFDSGAFIFTIIARGGYRSSLRT